MSGGLPKKIIDSIDHDVKKAAKAKKVVWSGIGPVAEAHLSACQTKAIVVWRQRSETSLYENLRTNFVVGIFHKQDLGLWEPTHTLPANYGTSEKSRSVEAIIKQEKGTWK